jgi:signal transduction histidine kinase
VERLLEPFVRLGSERVAAEGGHYGLGLSIARAIATAHEATITAEAPADGGLAITVRFPATEDRRHTPPSHG